MKSPGKKHTFSFGASNTVGCKFDNHLYAIWEANLRNRELKREREETEGRREEKRKKGIV